MSHEIGLGPTSSTYLTRESHIYIVIELRSRKYSKVIEFLSGLLLHCTLMRRRLWRHSSSTRGYIKTEDSSHKTTGIHERNFLFFCPRILDNEHSTDGSLKKEKYLHFGGQSVQKGHEKKNSKSSKCATLRWNICPVTYITNQTSKTCLKSTYQHILDDFLTLCSYIIHKQLVMCFLGVSKTGCGSML